MRLRCRFDFHDWRMLSYGAPHYDLDARQCWGCRRFEVAVYGRWYKAERRLFEPIRKAGYKPPESEA